MSRHSDDISTSTRKMKTAQGTSRNTKFKNKHKKRRSKAKYRGQGK